MDKHYDAISVGDLNVEFFNTTIDGSFIEATEIVGPYPSGAAAIFIDTMAKLGARTCFIGTVGNDEFGDCIINRLQRDKIETDCVARLDNEITGIAFRTSYSDGTRKFIYDIGNAAAGKLSCAHVDEDRIKSSRWLHVSGNVLAFSGSAKEAVLKAVDIAYANSVPISLDPNLRFEMMKAEEIHDLLSPILWKTTLLLPSSGELQYLSGCDDEEAGAADLIRRGIKMIARKEGAKGSSIFTEDGKLSIKPFRVNEADSTGCGDSFGGAFVFGLLSGYSLQKAGEIANAVGAITATRYGPMEGIESLDEVAAFIQAHEY